MTALLCLQIACANEDERKKLVELLNNNGYSMQGEGKITAMASDRPIMDQYSSIEQIMMVNQLNGYDKLDVIEEIFKSQDPDAIVYEAKRKYSEENKNRNR